MTGKKLYILSEGTKVHGAYGNLKAIEKKVISLGLKVSYGCLLKNKQYEVFNFDCKKEDTSEVIFTVSRVEFNK